MPTKVEYQDRFFTISDNILSGPCNTKAEARHLVVLAKQAVRRERDRFMGEISLEWKKRFAEIKSENDSWQQALHDAFKDEIDSIDERLSDMYEGLHK